MYVNMKFKKFFTSGSGWNDVYPLNEVAVRGPHETVELGHDGNIAEQKETVTQDSWIATFFQGVLMTGFTVLPSDPSF
jgi:hypothetical protein